MTEKRYLSDPYIRTFDATITDVITKDGQSWVKLDQTYFYPEGGGQPADTGQIGDAAVLDVQLFDDVPYHQLSAPITLGTKVHCELDFERRFDLMQQHTGQHLLSHGLELLFDAATIGFHLTLDNLTVDCDQKLDQEAILKLEDYCNAMILENLPTLVHYPDPETLRTMPLRKQPKVTENIRIIEIQDKDFSPCGGTHLKTTAEIQLIKIKRFEAYKTGTRLEFVCGGRALSDYRDKSGWIQQLSNALSSAPKALLEAVERLKQENDALKKELQTFREQALMNQIDSSLQNRSHCKAGDLVILDTEGMEAGLFRKASALITPQIDGICLLINRDSESFQLILAQSDNKPLDLQSLFKTLKEIHPVKGGGSPIAVQGGGPRDLTDTVKVWIIDQLQ